MQDAKKQFAAQLREAMQAAGYEPKPVVLEREFNTRHWGKPMSLHGVRLWLLGETMPDFKKAGNALEMAGCAGSATRLWRRDRSRGRVAPHPLGQRYRLR